MGHRHHFDLFELVLAQHARGVAPGAARLRPEALCVGDIAAGKIVFVHRFAVDDVCQRHLGGGHQPPAIGGLVAVFAEFRQLTRTIHHVVAHKDRGPCLGQAVLGDVCVQHELRQSPVYPRHGTRHHDKA